MKTPLSEWRRATMTGGLLSIIAASAAGAEPHLEPSVREDRNQFSLSSRFLCNVSAQFRHGAAPANPGPGVGVHGVDRVYDNGYVRVDESGNAGGSTWNWGFAEAGNVVGSTLELSALSSPANGTAQSETGGPQYGFEIGYSRVLKRIELSRDRALKLGLGGSFGVTLLDIQSDAVINGVATGVKDTYKLDGLPIVPGAPYSGGSPSPGGSLPLLLPDSPDSRVPINLAASASERMKVEGQLYGIKLGPFLEVPLTRRLNARLQAGVTSVFADGEFSYQETLSTGGSSAAAGRRSEWLIGGFVEGQLSFRLSRGWDAFAGAGWQGLGNFDLSAGTKEASVRLDRSVSVFGGFNYRF